MREELGITDYVPKEVTHYVYDSRKEREMVYVYSTVYDKPIHPDAVELSDGRFWSMQEIKMNIGQGIFTPNFEEEFQKYFL